MYAFIPSSLSLNNSVIRKTVSLMSAVVCGWFNLLAQKEDSYRFGVQGAQDLNQSSVHLLWGSLEEFPTSSYKQCVTCKGG